MASRVRLLVRLACAALALVASAPAGAQSPFTHRIPIHVPKGASGVQPDLSLVHVPGAGNGIAGLGWRLAGIPTISRVNYGNAISNTDSDTFVHSELGVLVKQSDGSYRSKNESFVKLVPTNGCGGPCTWLAYLPSGGKVHYWSPAGGAVPTEWTASYFDDVHGNYWEIWYDVVDGHSYPARAVYTKGPGYATYRTVVFEYEARPDVEPSYARGALDKVTRRLKWIRVRSGVTDTYGTGGTLVRKYRLDYQTTGMTGRSQLVSIQQYGSNGDDAACAALPAPATCAMPAQTFTYAAETFGAAALPVYGWGTYGDGGSVAAGRYRFGDFDGDGKADVLYIDNGGALLVSLSGTTGASGPRHWGFFGDGAAANLGRYQIGDYNGDGKADVLWVGHDSNPAGGNTHLYVALSTGKAWASGDVNSGFVGRGDWGIFGNGNDLGRYRIADYDGDGKADVGFIGGDGMFWVIYSSGAGFGNGTGIALGRKVERRSRYPGIGTWVSLYGDPGEVARYRIGDFNGDGKADAAFIAPNNELWVSLSTGRALAAATAWVNSTNSGQLPEYSGWELGIQWGWVNGAAWGNGNDLGRYQFGDVNGDGKTDLVFIGGGGLGDVHVRPATGSEFGPSQYCGGFENGVEPARYQLADLNGDGRADVLYIAADGTLKVRVAKGTSFSAPYGWGVFGNGADLPRYFVMDFTGDGKADFLFIGGEPNGANLALGKPLPADPVMTKVENGIGGTVSIAYAQAADLPGAIVPPAWDQNGAPAWWQADVAPRLLVTRVTTEDGRGGRTSVTYSYDDGRVLPGYVPDRRNLGFRSMSTRDDQTGQTSTTYSNQAPGLEGTAWKIESRTYTGLLVKEQFHDYERVFPPGTTGVELVREYQETLKTYELGSFVFSQSTTTTYDDYGNARVKTQYADGLPTVTVTIDYRNDATNWVLGRLERMTTSSGGVTLGDMKNTWVGNVVTEKSEWLDTKNVWLTTKMGYDANGNLTSVTEPLAGDGLVRTTITQYDPTYRAYPTKVTNALNQFTETLYKDSGLVWYTKDVNGRQVTYDYDVFGRKKSESGPGNRYTEWEYRNYGDPSRQCDRVSTWVDGTRLLWKEEYFDGSGFKYGVTSSGECSAWLVVNNEKDAAGRVSRTSMPYCYGTPPESIKWTTTEYDAAGRVAKIRAPDNKETRFEHTTTYASTIDANNQTTKKYFNARNKTTAVVDAAGETRYDYDALGRLIAITPPGTSSTRIWYDSLNRRTRVEEPQVAASTYDYDWVGNITTLVSRGKTVAFKYDALNRVVRKQPGGEAPVTYTYDETSYANGKGRVTTLVDPAAATTTHFSYTDAGQIAGFQKVIGGRSYSQTFGYDRGGRLEHLTYPDGSYSDYSYTGGGSLQTVTLNGAQIATWSNHDPLGRPRSVAYGNGVSTSYAYDWAEHLTSLVTKRGASVLQDLTYDWYGRPNTSGLNIGSITDNRVNKIAADGSNTDETQAYTYDAVYRLTQASGVWGAKSYGYSATGNPQTFGGATARTLYYTGEQVTSGTGLSSVTYDPATGAMTRRILDGVDSRFDWTVEGRLSRVTRNGLVTAQMTYDADGQRVKKVYTPSTGPSVTTTYATPMYEVRTFSDGRVERHTLHLFANGQLIASVTKDGNILTASNNSTRWRAEWAVGAMYSPASLEGLARKLVHGGRALAAHPTAIRWGGLTLFALVAAWVLVVALTALRRRGYGRRFSPSLRLATAGVVLVFGFTACTGGPGAHGTSQEALITGNTLQGPPPGTHFYHRNHINSSSVITDHLGNEVTRYVYLPFGELASGNSAGKDSVTAKFTGQEFDEETGLYYYNARYYDPAIGRFLSPDTVLPSLTDAQQLNRYSYVRNNPVMYVDPTGHFSWNPVKEFLDAAGDAARAVADAATRAVRWVANAAEKTGDYFARAGEYAWLITKATVSDRATLVAFLIAAAISIATLNPGPLYFFAVGTAASIVGQSLALAAGVRNPTVLMIIGNVAALAAGSGSLTNFLKGAGALAITMGLAYAEKEAFGAETATRLAPLNALIANLVVNGLANELEGTPNQDQPKDPAQASPGPNRTAGSGGGDTRSSTLNSWKSISTWWGRVATPLSFVMTAVAFLAAGGVIALSAPVSGAVLATAVILDVGDLAVWMADAAIDWSQSRGAPRATVSVGGRRRRRRVDRLSRRLAWGPA